MHSLTSTLCLSFMAIGRLAGVAPICSNITNVAGGGLPNSGIPSFISPNAVKGFQLALFLEILELSYFSSGLTNITNWGTNGYGNDTIDIVSKIVAQEEVHVATVVEILEAYDKPLILPCNYSFPVNSTEEFFELADVITSVGIGATIGLAERLAFTDPILVKSVSSILTVESRHDAFFRHLQGLVPNPAPFDTGISDIWAYNLALSFIVPGSCQVEVPLPILPTLTVSDPSCSNPTTSNSKTSNSTASYSTTSNSTADMSLREFAWDPAQMTFVAEAGKQLLVGWVNQLNTPVYTPLNITVKGKGTAVVPQGMNGVVFAAVTTQQPDNVDDLALATLAGPVVIRLS